MFNIFWDIHKPGQSPPLECQGQAANRTPCCSGGQGDGGLK